jgi:hypothetical protein
MPGSGGNQAGAVSLEKLAQACVKPGERTIEPYETGFKVKVRLPNGRHQAVFLLPFMRKDGRRLIRVYTYCGKPTPDSLGWALRANTKLTRGALGLAGEGNEEQFVLVCCYDDETARPEQIKQAVKDIAFHGDEIEQKMTGMDEL